MNGIPLICDMPVNTNKTFSAIIQARLQSKRLPGKSLLTLGGKPLIAHVIERAQQMKGIDKVIVATCQGNEALVECASGMGAFVFVGSEQNVLDRYYNAACEFGGDYIVRITGDNPFTDVEYGSKCIERTIETGADLFSFSGLPLGVGVEIFSKKALDRSFQEAETPYQKEHVSPFIKEHPELFSIMHDEIVEFLNSPKIRLTVDTEEDFCLAGNICMELYKGEPFSVRDIFSLAERNPEIIKINQNVLQRSMTHSET
jgi:spore coat polysaccharide biosynthesis protein SpsF